MKENWREIPGYEGLYEVSDIGNVRSICRVVHYANGSTRTIQGKVLTKNLSNGYHAVTLSRNNSQKIFLVHRLVALLFLGSPKSNEVVNHKDGNKTNNAAINLEWCTQKENVRHAITHLGVNYNNHPKRVIRSDGRVFSSIKDAAKSSNTSRGNIWHQINGNRKHAGGFSFMFMN